MFLVQPIRNISEIPIIVKMALQLVLLINVDEKDQVMHTNVWLTLVNETSLSKRIDSEMARLPDEVESCKLWRDQADTSLARENMATGYCSLQQVSALFHYSIEPV